MTAPRVQQIVVMGVSGVGKTTVALGMAAALGWDFAEGDDFHPEANVAKMRAGEPLDDADRWPWLRAIGGWLAGQVADGRSSVVTCSALRRSYRDLLREGQPELAFCHLAADPEDIAERLGRRTGHYMPASLLSSQLAALDPLGPDEPGVTVDAGGEPEEVVVRALEALGLRTR